ncbi:hypothetical protein F2Q70_00004667 [Brassica cretica]|uniref:Uncharacterized protein n=2 Tax=Brassica cretica TaxID=69181 RepID=A0A8S9G0I5_BRACR|nr:hypothetical protein F2Q68_00021504 [Brassica cretica]KAF2574354.1 hypothetical protein F2Q70_00004667 [Brassica cretica]KAF3565873.1 hypothetical protein DY000_02016772 [Brassica cretica]
MMGKQSSPNEEDDLQNLFDEAPSQPREPDPGALHLQKPISPLSRTELYRSQA